MKTISIQAIDPGDGKTRNNEVLVSRIIGWYTRNRHYRETPASAVEAYWEPFVGPTTIVSIDSGVEYEIAETIESFTKRISELVDASPIFEIADPPAVRIPEIDAEIAMAERLYDEIRAIEDRATGVDAIVNRFDDLQKEHCRNSHYGECLSSPKESKCLPNC